MNSQQQKSTTLESNQKCIALHTGEESKESEMVERRGFKFHIQNRKRKVKKTQARRYIGACSVVTHNQAGAGELLGDSRDGSSAKKKGKKYGSKDSGMLLIVIQLMH